MSTEVASRIVHVDLAAPLPALGTDPAGGSVQLFFWLGDAPLGRCEIAADTLPLSREALAALASQAVAPAVGARLFAGDFDAPLPALAPETAAHGDVGALLANEAPLAALAASLSQPPAAAAPPVAADVSLVICTRDRPAELERCLAALRRLTTRAREIVVVDNAPRSDATRRLVSAMPGVRYVAEPRPGLSIARNTGVRATTGSIVAFTDDDVVVGPEWIARLLPPFADERTMVVTGTVLPGELETRAQRMAEERLWGFNREFRRRTFDAGYFAQLRPRGVPVWHVGAGANMAIRREAFARVGLFDERLGAGAAGCSEDSELWYRVLAGGWSCVYEPAAVVFHHHRADIESLQRQWHAYMRGHVAALLIQFSRHRHWGNLGRIVLQLPFFYAVWLRDALRSGDRGERAVWQAAATGALSGLAYHARHRSVAPVG
jgi:GT2 family glycosyltransferase